MNKPKTKKDFSWLASGPVAHRGLFTAGTEAEENTLEAIAAAADAGYAIEIDVRLTLDNQVVVIHDARLERMTNGTGYVSEYTLEKLQALKIGKTNQHIPLLTDVLDIVAERVPLYIEIKCPQAIAPGQICAGVRFALEGYHGQVAIMSFNPKVPTWFRHFSKQYARGVILDFHGLSTFFKRFFTHRGIKASDPHFLAVDIQSLPNPLAKKWRESGKPIVTWTVKSPTQESIGGVHADALLFEMPAVVGDQE